MTNPTKNLSVDMPETPFERIKQVDDEGNEFWSARDLMELLNYMMWQNFKNVLNKAQNACENSGYNPDDHFVFASRLKIGSSGVKRKIEDMHLSRYACYLIIQNADSSKEAVALGQTYFAVQTRKLELSAARTAGVLTPQDFAIFQNHGYKGLYSGLTAEAIHKRKKLKKSQHILDHMGNTELAANLFRSTQAEDKLRRENIQGKTAANEVHFQAGVIVRRAISEMGGTMPENLPTAESIKKLESGEKKKLPKAKLPE